MSILHRVTEALADFREVSQLAGLDDQGYDLKAQHLVPHNPRLLPADTMQVYVFAFRYQVLKVGRTTHNARSRYQHYGLNRSASSLANSLLFHGHEFGMGAADLPRLKEWICANIDRVNVDLPRSLGLAYLNLLEAFLIARLQPRFEGRESGQEASSDGA